MRAALYDPEEGYYQRRSALRRGRRLRHLPARLTGVRRAPSLGCSRSTR
jgi:hypothetical protein